MGTVCGPHLQNQDEEDMLYVHMYFEHNQASHLYREKSPMVPQSNQLEAKTQNR